MISIIFSWMENWKIDWYFHLTVFLFIYQLTHYGLMMPYGGTHEYGHTIQIPSPFSQARVLFSAVRPDRREECSFFTVCGLPSCSRGLTWYQIASVCMHLEDVIYCPIYHLFYANFTPVWRTISPRGHFYCFQMRCSRLYVCTVHLTDYEHGSHCVSIIVLTEVDFIYILHGYWMFSSIFLYVT